MCRKKKKTNQEVESTSKLDLLPNEKFEAVKYRHENQTKALQKMSDIDLKIFIGFLTLQLVLGGFIAQTNLDLTSKIGLGIIDLSLSLICTVLLYNNYRRRKEVVETVKNCNNALKFDTPDFYITTKSIDSKTKFRAWFWWYIIGVIVSVFGILVIIKASPDSNKTEKSVETKIITKNNPTIIITDTTKQE